jgi:hypothetical protein
MSIIFWDRSPKSDPANKVKSDGWMKLPKYGLRREKTGFSARPELNF